MTCARVYGVMAVRKHRDRPPSDTDPLCTRRYADPKVAAVWGDLRRAPFSKNIEVLKYSSALSVSTFLPLIAHSHRRDRGNRQ